MTDTAATARGDATLNDPALKPTPLHARHVASGARMVPYAGWDMPVEYAGITAEHMAVRTRAGVFDVSHMGEIEIAGKDALKTVQHLTCNDASRLGTGQAQYSALLTPEGTFVDDILVYRMAPSHFMIVVNAANTATAVDWITTRAKEVGDAAVVDSSARYALIAIQGPAALDTVQPLTGADLASVRPYWFTYGEVAQARALISRTGYTGEDGFEIFVPPNMADRVWQALLQAGHAAGVVPCGLGARDTLRLEAAMRLYGQDIDDATTPLEAGLGGIVGWDKPAFLGAERLRAQKAAGAERRLVGLEMIDRGIARHGYAVQKDGAAIGTVTSGTQTPFLKKAIAMAYVPPALATPGTRVDVDIRGRASAATVVPLPFYKRPRGGDAVAGL
jgi:aminomethyltransferase